MLKLGFIGAGTLGTALAVRLSGCGYHVAAVYSRRRAAAADLAQTIRGCQVLDSSQSVADRADLVFITTPDDAIATVAAQVKWHDNQSVVHCSGADTTDILQPARAAGTRVGVFHPLQTFAGAKQAIDNIPGSTFAIETEGPLRSTLKEMATALGGRWVELKPEDKAAYHTTAVIASNYLVTLTKLAGDLWQTFSVPPEEALPALLPLLRGTINNIESVGIPQCLTGPIARGDIGTIKKHLAALRAKAPDILAAYCELGRQTIPIALAKGKISREQAGEIKRILDRKTDGNSA